MNRICCHVVIIVHDHFNNFAWDHKLTDDLMELRVKGALPRMEALNNVVQDHKVNFMATICALCKAQFSKVLPYYGFEMSMVGGIHQLVSTAIKLDTKQ